MADKPATEKTADTGSQVVYLIDDNADIRESISYLLRSWRFHVEAYPSGPEFLENVESDVDGCAILDILMPVMSGIEVLQELQRRHVYFPVIMLTAHADIPVAVESMRLGAFDFLQKGGKDHELIDCVCDALDYSRRLQENFRDEMEIRKQLDNLTRRESQVLNHVIHGQTSRQIADELGIAVKTVDAHRANLMKKMNVNKVAELIHKVVKCRRDDQA